MSVTSADTETGKLDGKIERTYISRPRVLPFQLEAKEKSWS